MFLSLPLSFSLSSSLSHDRTLLVIGPVQGKEMNLELLHHNATYQLALSDTERMKELTNLGVGVLLLLLLLSRNVFSWLFLKVSLFQSELISALIATGEGRFWGVSAPPFGSMSNIGGGTGLWGGPPPFPGIAEVLNSAK